MSEADSEVGSYAGIGGLPGTSYRHWDVLADPEGNEFCAFAP